MELSDKYIFILGTTKFDNPYESASYTLAKHLAEKNNVFYIENPFTWKDFFKYRNGIEFERRKGAFSRNSNGILDTEIPGLKILITPLLLSINFLPEGIIYRLLLNANEKLISNRIKKVLAIKSIKDFIYINSFNFHYPNVADLIHPSLCVYHCVDPLIMPFDRKHGLISEPTLLMKSDLVVCTSKQLYKEKKPYNNNTYFIPNAADISHSGKALNAELKIHESISKIPKPIIGYFGNIERRIDYSLLRDVAELNPDKSFVFAGPISKEFIPEWFLKIPNVYMTGRLDYVHLPEVLKGFDIAIIPFKKDEVSNTIFPLKLFEYLGAGKPVVAIDFNPDLEEFTKGTVRYCADAATFSAALNHELQSNSDTKISRRIAVANENTWSKRISEFSQLLNSKLS